MLIFNRLFHSLPICLGIVFTLYICSVSAFAADKPEIFVQLGHSKTTQTVSFSDDGKYLVTGSVGKIVKLWEVATGAEIRTFVGHAAEIGAVAVSSDGGLVVSGDKQGVIKLWNALTGQEINSIMGHSKEIRGLTFAPDNRIFSSVADDSTMKTWNVSTGQLIKTIINIRGLPCLVSGNKFVLAGYENISLVDISTASELGTFKAGINFTSASFSRDGRFALLLGLNYTLQKAEIELLDVVANKRIAYWNTDKDAYYVALSPDGRRALSAGLSGMKLWDATNGKELKTLTTIETFYAAFSPDGRFIISAKPYDATLWDTNSGGVIRSFTGRPLSDIYSATISPDGSQAITNSNNAPPLLWDIVRGKPVKSFKGYSDASTYIANGKYILFTGQDNARELWDAVSQKPLKKLQSVYAGFTSDGRYAAELIAKDRLKVWETATGKTILNYTEPTGKINGFNLTANNYILVMLEKSAKRVDIISGSEEMFRWEEPHIWKSAISLDGRFIAVIVSSQKYEKTTLKLYDVEARKVVRSYVDVVPAASVTFSPDSRQILFSTNNNLVLCDVSTGVVLKTLTGHTDIISGMSFSRGGERILSTGGDQNIRLWSTATGKELMTFVGHQGAVRARISPNGEQLISDGGDHTTRLWNITTGKEQAKLLSFTDEEWIVITPEGYFNASPGGTKYINVRVGNNVYGIDQFYAKFFRPELVQLALAGKELPKGELITDIAAQKPAPNVQILSPVTNSSVDQDSVAVTLKITDIGGGIGSVNVYLNGAQVANDTRGVNIKGKALANEKILSFTIPLVKGQNEIRAVAFNGENSMESNPALISIISRAVMQKPNLYALVVGINTYKNQSISLTYAVPDAVAFAGTLQKVATPLFDKADIRTLTTPAATTKEAITRAFEEVRQLVRPNDLFIFYNASHGTVDVVNGEEQYFLLTSNVRLLSSQHISKDALSHKDLVQLIGSIPAQKKLVILDTCNAGKGGKEIQIALLQQTRGLTDATAVKLLQRSVGSSVFSASADTQQALEGYKGHGLFTYVLMEGLLGKADFKKDGFITVKGLALHTEERVMTLSEEVFKRQQNPMIETGANDFPIGKIR